MANPEIIFTCNSHCLSSNISGQIQLSQHVTHNIQFCYKKTTVWNSIRSNPPWQQSNKHVKSISHTQFNNNWKINSHTSNQDETQSQWDISPHSRAKITCNSTQAGTRSRIQDPTSQLHEGIWRIRSHGPVTSKREEYMLLFTTTSSFQGNKFHDKD
jgi:hypothetical protein